MDLAGIQILAVGMEGADREQLRRLVTSEESRNVFFVQDSNSLSEVEMGLASALCIIDGVRHCSCTRGEIACSFPSYTSSGGGCE